MTQQEAISIIKQAIESVPTNWATHLQMQEAAQVLENSITYQDDKGNIWMGGAKPPGMNQEKTEASIQPKAPVEKNPDIGTSSLLNHAEPEVKE